MSRNRSGRGGGSEVAEPEVRIQAPRDLYLTPGDRVAISAARGTRPARLTISDGRTVPLTFPSRRPDTRVVVGPVIKGKK